LFFIKGNMVLFIHGIYSLKKKKNHGIYRLCMREPPVWQAECTDGSSKFSGSTEFSHIYKYAIIIRLPSAIFSKKVLLFSIRKGKENAEELHKSYDLITN